MRDFRCSPPFCGCAEIVFRAFSGLHRKVLPDRQVRFAHFEGADDLIQFQMARFGVAVLGVLDQEHHEKSDDGCGRINNELPGIGEMKRWDR